VLDKLIFFFLISEIFSMAVNFLECFGELGELDFLRRFCLTLFITGFRCASFS